MATICKRDKGWQAQICVCGVRKSRTFLRKEDAKRWAERTTADIQAGRAASSTLTLADLCDKYARTVTPAKSDTRYEHVKLEWWAKSDLGKYRIVDITPRMIQDFVDERASKVESSSAKRELVLLQATLSWAVKKGWLASNPCHEVAKPKDNPPRDRVASPEEIAMLMHAAGWREDEVPVSKTARVAAAFLLSCLTGMRGGEIIRLTSEMLDLDAGVIHLPASITKTRKKRAVACGERAVALLRRVLEAGERPEIFGLDDASRDALFRKIRALSGIQVTELKPRIHFHDARATFCTWAASPGEDGAPHLDVLSLAKQLGHQNIRQLMTYYRPKPEDLAKRLA